MTKRHTSAAAPGAGTRQPTRRTPLAANAVASEGVSCRNQRLGEGMSMTSWSATAGQRRTSVVDLARQLEFVGERQDEMERAGQIEQADLWNLEQYRLDHAILDSQPQTLCDAATMLLAASGWIRSNSLRGDGVRDSELGEIIVRRVAYFLADQAGFDLAAIKALASPRDAEALTGTAVEAAKRFYKIDEAEEDRRLLGVPRLASKVEA